jgi:predicted  nucleic acid-binding Zn-ribbon protein
MPKLELTQEIDLHMERRLDKIEEKIDRLADAMVSIARAEEKLAQMEIKQSAHYDRMNRFSQKLDDIELQVRDNASTVNLINKLFWVAIVAVAGAVAAQIWM